MEADRPAGSSGSRLGTWIALASAGAALAAAVAAFRAAHQADVATYGPALVPGRPLLSVLDGRAFRAIGEDAREYAFLLSLANAGPLALTVSDLVLRVTYRTRANFLGAVDIAPDDSLDAPEDSAFGMRLTLPLRIQSGDSTTLWARFRSVNTIPRHCRPDEYAIIATTVDGVRARADASLPAVMGADTDGTGAATWGWD